MSDAGISTRSPRLLARIAGSIITLALAVLIELLVSTPLRIPNPPAFLVIAIVFSAYIGGVGAGLISAAIAWTYIAYFFSQPGQPFQYNDDNLRRVIVWAFTMPLTAYMVGLLNRRTARALAEAEVASVHQAQMEEHLRNITERRRAEEELRKSESLRRVIIETEPECVKIVGRDCTLLEMNPAGLAMIEADQPEQVVGKSVLAVIAPEWRATFEQLNDKVFHGETVTAEFEIVGLKGSRRWMETHAVPLRDKDSNIIAQLAITRDITERKQVEEKLRISEARYRSLIETQRDAIARSDLSGRLIFVNDAYCRVFGKSREELLGHVFTPIIFPEDQHLALDVMRTIQSPPHRSRHESRHPTESGVRWFEWDSSAVLDERGNILELQGVGRDITERKQAEEKFKGLLESAPDAMVIVDEEGKIRIVNSQTEKVFGYKREELYGQTIELLIPERFRNTHPNHRAGYILNPKARSMGTGFDLYGLRNDGSEFPVDISLSPLNTEDGILVTAAIRDITERKRDEEALRHRLAELEAVSRISAALRSAQTLGEMLPVLLDETLAALESEAGVIWLYYPENDALRISVARGWMEQLKESPIKPGQGIAGTVFASGQSHLSREFATDPLTRPSTVESIPSGWGGICVPVRTAVEVVGVLFVSVPLPREITPEESNLLASLAEIAGTALHRLRLHEQTVRRLEHLQALQTIDRAITSSFDVRITLNTLLEQLTAQLSVDAAGVLLFKAQSLTLEYAAGRGFHTQNYERSRIRLGEGIAGRAALERRLIQNTHILESQMIERAALLRSEGFVAYTVTPFMAKGQVKGVLEVFHRESLQPDAEWLDFLETLAGQAAIAIDNIQMFESLQRSNMDLTLAYDATIEGWSHALDLRDKETEGHTLRVTEMTLRLARAANMTEDELVHVKRGALLHDIGKVGIPDAILLKPDKLTEAEWAVMRQHPIYAYEMLSPIEYLHSALDIPYCHHEKWDGSGYPRGLKGEQIPLSARLFAVADVWDALLSDRPYRKALTKEKVREYIRAQAGTHFDPQAVELFFRILK